MKFWRAYDIDIIKLNEGKHEFSFKVGDEFFDHFKDNDIVEKGDLKVTVLLKKEANLLEAIYKIDGSVELTCDRSLEKFDQPLHSEEKIIYKYGPEEQEINEEIFMITRDTPSINIAQLIYEFVILALPAKKIHPDYKEDEDEEDLDSTGEFVYWSDELSEEDPEEGDTEDSKEDQIDPRWEALKNIKKKD
ncbi:DUF177 domain-containing protein [Echinicola sp. CAU 1574]|uniref:DUF177 domain-containing protein n=1 Tax=Echinicola arenosa TaxID=2774144 RepID=A0ABR9APN9_9BACT|nr:DUF177 domain-containing protein [Echinicola arenosa]MBD8490322.1 DUF177 domain-containing protein [Echinicola arenosa]